MVRFDLGRFDQRGRFVSKRDVLTGDGLTMRRFDCGTFWQWDVLTGYHWRHLANAIEPSICCGDAALCQITLTTCYKFSAMRKTTIHVCEIFVACSKTI